MKYCLLFFSFLFFSFSFSQIKNSIKGKITEESLESIKTNFNWNGEELLVVNFRQPNKNCHYDVNSNLKVSLEWFNKFYENVNLENAKVCYVFSDSISAKMFIDNESYFRDRDNLFLNFFNKTPYCYALMVIRGDGVYVGKGSEYNEEEIEAIIQFLNK